MALTAQQRTVNGITAGFLGRAAESGAAEMRAIVVAIAAFVIVVAVIVVLFDSSPDL